MVSTLKSINSIKLEDIQINDKMINYNKKSTNVTVRQKISSNPSEDVSTAMPVTLRDDVKYSKNSSSLQHTDHKSKNNSVAFGSSTNDNFNDFEASPIQEKIKKRKLWRIGKSTKLQNKLSDPDALNSMPKEFYSLGNSINKTESISINSHITSSVDTKSK